MGICVDDDSLKITWPPNPPSVTASREFVPVEPEVHDKQRDKSKGDHTDGGERVAEVAPVTRPKVEHSAGDEGERDGVGTGHPLTMLDDLAITRGDEGGGGTDDPGCGLPAGSGKARTAGGEGDSGSSADKY